MNSSAWSLRHVFPVWVFLFCLTVCCRAAAAEPSGNLPALGFRISALQEKDPAKRAELLLRSFAADPAHGIRSAALLIPLLPHTEREFIGKVEEFCAAHPESLPAGMLYVLCRAHLQKDPVPGRERLYGVLSARAAGIAQAPEEEQKLWINHYELLLDFHLDTAAYEAGLARGEELALRLSGDLRSRALLLLINYCRLAVFRTQYTYPGTKRWATLPPSPLKAGYDRVWKLLRAEDRELSGALLHQRIRYYIALGEKDAWTLVRERVPGNTPGARLLRLEAAKEFAEPADFEAALRAVPAPMDRQTLERFLYYSRRKEWKKAEAEIGRIPRESFRTLLRLAHLQNCRRYRELRALALEQLENGICTPEIISALLVSAEQLRDPALLRRAMALVGKKFSPNQANSLGYIAAELNVELDAAEKLLNFAVTAEEQNSAFLDSMAWLCCRRGRYQEAREWIRRARLWAIPDSGIGVILFHSGLIERALGNEKEARKFLESALRCGEDPELDPAAVRKALDAPVKK